MISAAYPSLDTSTWLAFCVLVGLLLLASCMMSPREGAAPSSPYTHWAAYYGYEANPEQFSGYDVVVLDADRHPDIAAIKRQGTKVLAYFSVSEIDSGRDYAAQFLSRPELILGRNERWQSHVIDVRSERWQAFVVNEWIPRALAQGFDGVFLDTMDTALDWQRKGTTYRHMDQALITLVGRIHRHTPKDTMMMVNRGFDILPHIAQNIDIVLAESILIDAHKPGRPLFEPHIYQSYVDKLQRLRQKHSHLSIFTLDYPAAIDKTAWLQVCGQHQAHGFVPYIAAIELQQIIPPMSVCR